jgi:nitroreductase
MDIEQAILKRRSIRMFQNRDVPLQALEKIINAGIHAPSNCNVQGWRFIVVNDRRLKERMVECGGSAIIGQAPVGVLVCYDHRSVNLEYCDWLQSASAATQNILLAANAMGLGGCWICHLPPKSQLRALFAIPAQYSPTAYIALGYPAHEPVVVVRKRTAAEVIGYNRFPMIARESSRVQLLWCKRAACALYFSLPLSLKKRLRKTVDRLFVKKHEN